MTVSPGLPASPYPPPPPPPPPATHHQQSRNSCGNEQCPLGLRFACGASDRRYSCGQCCLAAGIARLALAGLGVIRSLINECLSVILVQQIRRAADLRLVHRQLAAILQRAQKLLRVRVAVLLLLIQTFINDI